MDEKAYLVVFAGANGAGKSSTIAKYLQSDNIEYICPDLIAATEYSHIKDEYERYVLAMDEAEKRRNTFLKNKEPFAFETVLSNKDKIDFLYECKNSDYMIVGIYISTLSPEINRQRVKRRVEQGGHDVPLDKIDSRYVKSLKLLPELIKVSDLCLVMDNSGDQLLYEFIKGNEKHYICASTSKAINDFVKENIIVPLEKEGISCNLLDANSSKQIEKEFGIEHLSGQVNKSIKERVEKAIQASKDYKIKKSNKSIDNER